MSKPMDKSWRCRLLTLIASIPLRLLSEIPGTFKHRLAGCLESGHGSGCKANSISPSCFLHRRSGSSYGEVVAQRIAWSFSKLSLQTSNDLFVVPHLPRVPRSLKEHPRENKKISNVHALHSDTKVTHLDNGQLGGSCIILGRAQRS